MLCEQGGERTDTGIPLRVLHAVRSDGFAGVERYVASVSSALAQLGHDVVTIGGDTAAMEATLADAPVRHVPASATLDVARALVRHGRGADVVHVHMTAAELAAVLVWPVVHAPVVATRHFARPRGSSIRGRAGRPLIRARLAAQLAISQFVSESIAEPNEIVRNGVGEDARVDPTGKVVLVAQRLEPEKHTSDALDAWAAASIAPEGWRLWIAGDGSERARLERTVERRTLEGVRFLGRRDDMASLRRQSGMLLAPAPAEPFGLSVAEAMASGLPVVAAGAGGHLETVGAVCPQLLFRPGDARSTGALLRQLAGDLELRRRLGGTLRDFQRCELSLARHVEELVGVYRRVTSAQPLPISAR